MRSVSGCAYRSSSGAVDGDRFRVVRRPLSLLAFVIVVLSVGAEAAAGVLPDPSLAKRREDRIRRVGPLVETLHFAGNETFEAGRLRTLMNTRETSFLSVQHFDRNRFEQDLANVTRYYESQGFLEARVVIDDMLLSDDGLAIEILIGVYEGPRWLVSMVTFEGNAVLSKDQLLDVLTIEPGGPYLPNELEADRGALLAAYARVSYLDAMVFQEVDRSDETHSVVVRYRIVERQQAVIGPIEISGDDKTRDFVIERELEFSPGELFDFKKIGESQARLYRTGLFNSVWIEPAPADTGKITKRMEVRVRERPGGLVDFRLGFAALDGATIGAEIVNRNIQGQAIEAGISGGFGERVREAEVSIGDPWFSGRRIGIKASGNYAWKDEISLETDGDDVSLTTEKAGAGFVLTRRLGRAFTVEGGYALEWMGSKLVLTSEEVADTTRTSTWTSDIFGAVMYDTRNDILDARRGMLARVETRLASSRLGGTNDFSQHELSWRGFKDIRHGRTVALSARVGWIKPQGQGGAPITERYFAGGEGSVRGFARNSLSPVGEDGEPVGGRALVELRAEVRFPVYKRLGAAAFVDAGQAFEDFGAITRAGLAVGAGGGLRFRTDFGVLRLDVATPVSESGSLQYYIGVGQAF